MSSSDITLPVLKYGYRTSRITWEELKIWIGKGDLDRLTRSEEQQLVYERFKRDLLSKWKSMLDYILCSKFPDHFQKQCDGDGKFEAVPSIEEATQGETSFALVPNDFPYYIDDHVCHHVYWKLGGRIADQEIEDTIRKLAPNSQDVLYWVNPVRLQSIPELDHVHFLVNKKETNEKRT